jgi:hypothetical protein
MQPDDERVILHPRGFEEALEGLLAATPKSTDRAAALDAMTFANPKVREILDREDGYITHDELMKRLRSSRA